MKRLWIHEVMRVYHDRITDGEDSNWLMENLKSVTSYQLKEDMSNLLRNVLSEDETEVTDAVGHWA